MATAHTLRYRPHIWAGLRRGYFRSLTCTQTRSAAHAVAERPPANEIAQQDISGLHHGGSPGINGSGHGFAPVYKARMEKAESPLRDVGYYASLPQYPTQEQYHQFTRDLFAKPPSAELMSTIIEQLKAQDFVLEWRELSRRPERLVWRHGLTCHFGGNRMQIVGEGLAPDDAFAAVFMGFVYQLHVCGWLEQVLDQQGVHDALQKQRRTFDWTPTAIAAKMHVYNFAARYLSMPTIKNTWVRKEHEMGIHAHVSIPGTPFTAVGIAMDSRQAEFKAYAALKRVIEVHFERRGQIVDMKDRSHVNLDNASSILRYYGLRQQFGAIRRTDEKVPGPDGTQWTATRFYWDGRPLSSSQEMCTQAQAGSLAMLEAAVEIVRKRPELFEEYQRFTADTAGRVPYRLNPTFASLNPDVVETLSECVDVVQDTELAKFELKAHQLGYRPQVFKNRMSASDNVYHDVAQSLAARSDELRQQQELEKENPRIAEIEAERNRLPIYKHKAQILAMVKNHDQCIIVGSTGSGKSTQVPQIILDDAIAEGRGGLCNVICTQPRRISSVALALSVCNERDKEPGDVVGYRIGGDYHNSCKRGGSITYCTTELLANELERADEDLPHNVSHIVIDEIHERTSHLERLLSTIKLTFSKRLAAGLRVPKLVLMSATVESDIFERYFEMVSQDGTVVRPPYLNVPGRVFQTETNFLESFKEQLDPELYQAIEKLDKADESARRSSEVGLIRAADRPQRSVQWDSERESAKRGLVSSDHIDVMVATIVHIAETTSGGSILAFLPGASEIRLVYQAMLKHKRIDFSDESKFEILMVHRLNPSHLVRALDRSIPGVRRIMLSTNIAESSITFPEVEFVVDSGLERTEGEMDIGDLQTLRDDRISRASVLQRAGRAGRTRPGKYYGTFTAQEMEKMETFPSARPSSTDRIHGLYLRAKIHFPEVPVEQVFDGFLTPIAPEKVKAAERYLRRIGALTEDGSVSAIGYAMYRTTLNPSQARMLLLGMLFRCLDRAIIMACLLTMKMSIFTEVDFYDVKPEERTAHARHFAQDSRSDLIAQLRAFEAYREQKVENASGASEWAREHGVEDHYFEQLQTRVQTIRRTMGRVGFFSKAFASMAFNANSDNATVLKMILCAGLYPNVAAHLNKRAFVTHQALMVRPSPNSVAFDPVSSGEKLQTSTERDLIGTLFCFKRIFSSKSGSSKYYVGEITPISPLMFALFSSDVTLLDDKPNRLLIDNSIPLQFSGDAAAASTFLEFKKIWDTALLAGMQRIAESWSIEKSKKMVLSEGLTKIILGAVQELLEYEEGQKEKRQEDVNKFLLGPEREEAVPRPDRGKIYIYPAARLEDCRSRRGRGTHIYCALCGEMGHDYDHCPKHPSSSTIDTHKRFREHEHRTTRPAWDSAWEAPQEESEGGATWTPSFGDDVFAEDPLEDGLLGGDPSEADNDFAELPSDSDHR